MVKELLTGNQAAAYAAKGVNVQVVAAYPITPQSPVVETISSFVETGKMPQTQFVTVESEQSAITALIAASATGSRVFTATSANGLAYMFELLCWAAGSRLPVVVCVAMRALGAPWSVWTDHQDVFSCRDTGFLYLFCETNQEIYDTVIMAYRIAEDSRVYLPMFVNYDGYIVSHTIMPVEVEDSAKIQEFLPPLKHHINIADLSNPKGVNPVTTPNPIPRGAEGIAPGYMEFRFSMQKAAEYSLEVIEQVAADFKKKFGRSYGNGIYKSYLADDAEILLFGVSSIASESRGVVDQLRKEGIKAGLISLKVFRPFPVKYLREAFKACKYVAVFDREVGYGYEGILAYELKAALYGSSNQPFIKGFILGLGGRDVTPDQIYNGVKLTINMAQSGSTEFRTDFLGLKLEDLGYHPPKKE
jgi:pyruvate/2-oxoacid:ferredoxin oxidoreductase alpha subunit